MSSFSKLNKGKYKKPISKRPKIPDKIYPAIIEDPPEDDVRPTVHDGEPNELAVATTVL